MTGAQFSEVDFDLLADYVGGALAGTPDEAVVAALVATDPAWRTAHEELSTAMASVGAQLTALGSASEPMPADLARRLDAAFASAVSDPAPIDAELAAPAIPFVTPVAGEAEGRHLVAVPGTGLDRERSNPARKQRWRRAVPFAAAAGVIAFVGFGADYLNHQSNGATDSASTAAGGGVTEKSAPGGAGPMAAQDAERDPPTVSDRDYDLASLSSAGVASLIRSNDVPSASAAQPPVSGPLARLVVGDALTACLQAIAAQNGAGAITQVPLIDYARYEGAPALIVRFVASNGEWVWATGPDCGLPGVGAAQLAAVKVG